MILLMTFLLLNLMQQKINTLRFLYAFWVWLEFFSNAKAFDLCLSAHVCVLHEMFVLE